MDLRTQRGAPRLIASLALLLLTLSDLVGSTQTQCLWDPLKSVRPRRCLAPVDDETGLADDLPWTHEPHCIFHGAADQKTEKYCVYTTTAFNENSGLSLITTPDIAASLVGGIENHTAAWSARYHLQVSGRPPPPTAKLAYRIADIPGKGKGVVATRMIHQYESIMVSYPTVIADNAFFPRDPSQAPEQGPFLCQRAAAQLVDRKRLLSLARSGERGLSLVEDIVRTNAFGLSINGRDHKGLYPEIAVRRRRGTAGYLAPSLETQLLIFWLLHTEIQPRLCPQVSFTPLAQARRGFLGAWSPLMSGRRVSAFARFTTRDLALEAIATKDIEAGEEILLSCEGPSAPHRFLELTPTKLTHCFPR